MAVQRSFLKFCPVHLGEIIVRICLDRKEHGKSFISQKQMPRKLDWAADINYSSTVAATDMLIYIPKCAECTNARGLTNDGVEKLSE